MKPFALALAMSLIATSSMAFGSFINSATPTLTFPKDTTATETVTKDVTPVGN